MLSLLLFVKRICLAGLVSFLVKCIYFSIHLSNLLTLRMSGNTAVGFVVTGYVWYAHSIYLILSHTINSCVVWAKVNHAWCLAVDYCSDCLCSNELSVLLRFILDIRSGRKVYIAHPLCSLGFFVCPWHTLAITTNVEVIKS